MKKTLFIGTIGLAAVLSGCDNIGNSSKNSNVNNNLQFHNGLTGSTCDGIEQWDSKTAYNKAGTHVSYKGYEYENAFWTQNEDPETKSGEKNSGQPWIKLRSCGDAPIPSPEPSPIPSPEPSASPLPIPTEAPPKPDGDYPVYPDKRGTYIGGTIVAASDGHLYKCLSDVIAPWCNSTAEWAYAPATGTAYSSAWSLVDGKPDPSPKPDTSPTPSPRPTASPEPDPSPIPPTGQGIVGYYASWSAAYTEKPAEHSLANVPPYITRVLISFVQPSCDRKKGTNAFGCGLDFSMPIATVRDAIKLAHQKNPNQKFLLSVGGATYPFGTVTQENVDSIIGLMNDMGADGIDIDYENQPICSGMNTEQLSCNTDKDVEDIITMFRASLPKDKMLTAATWSVGAYGNDKFPTTTYLPLSGYSGLFVNPLKKVGGKLNEVYIMSYDAGNTSTTGYNPKQALLAYADIYPIDRLYLGLEVPNEAWGGNVLTVSQGLDYANYVKEHKAAGVMIWSLHKPAPTGETANDYMQPICRGYGLSGCNQKFAERKYN